ncbi:hypothetical protein [Sorangium sp. So ce131]|uniref:hypothetical protein n=1 Tax=Sorangium sp. So ce131 TaxID=3133282 RepID=UPI003F5E0281
MRTRSDADGVVERLMGCGYRREAVSLVTLDAPRTQDVCGPMGGALSAAVASVVVPGLGLVAAGPVAAALAGAGSAVGGIAGALVVAGVPEGRAQVYEAGLKQGAVLVCVYAYSERDKEILEMLLEYAGAENVRSESLQERPYDSFI